jgi:hypothetical protein
MWIQAHIPPTLGAIHNIIQIHDPGKINDFTYEDFNIDAVVVMAETAAAVMTTTAADDRDSGNNRGSGGRNGKDSNNDRDSGGGILEGTLVHK